MENSLKGMLIALTVFGLFVTCVLNFIILFPQEQGVNFNTQPNNSYLVIAQNNDSGANNNILALNKSSSEAYNQLDITQGFMGSNQIKQSQGGIGSMVTKTFDNLRIIATQLFTANSPIVYALGIFSVLTATLVFYYLYKFIRTGL